MLKDCLDDNCVNKKFLADTMATGVEFDARRKYTRFSLLNQHETCTLARIVMIP